jgi:uncharacterized protein (TIGR02466 family)
MNFVDLFPRTIAVTELKSLTPALMQEARAVIDRDPGITVVETDGSYTREQQLLDLSLFTEVKAEIIELCLEFARQGYGHKVEAIDICNSWGNVVKYGQNIRYHKHNNSYISGSFYLSEGSFFNILNMGYHELFGIMPEIDKQANCYRSWESFNINVKPGRIVMFPSGLQHCVLPSNSQENRYSIAFNAIPVGKIGSETGFMHIQIIK